ncbi:hypothetical protein K4L44_05435 [Halosquirtibacter laminarini]|uniref:Uncharacterized protein n=1 Tax=Halosquirtibacter laminarini TaxID=3374600 RepID=A0AC61NHY1_9BACT|nr:hypothetical protein K4L44_05435 [Prolixibacteraceae bacterium]
MNKNKDYFWIGYSDLMTAMFFLMLMCFVFVTKYDKDKISTIKKEVTVLKKEKAIIESVQTTIKKEVTVLKKEKAIIESVQKNIEKLKDKKDLFLYDSRFKRYTLKFDVQFRTGCFRLDEQDVIYFNKIKHKLDDAARELKVVIDRLDYLKQHDASYKNISYLIVVTGSASRIGRDDVNYLLSYQRAYYLYKYWKNDLKIDFDAPKYHNLVEFQIAGNGIGGVGRFPIEKKGFSRKNQRFIINVIPKFGEL